MDKILTAEEYMDLKRFPLSTQTEYGGLELEDQLMIDAVNLDNLHEKLENGESLTPEQQARLTELEEKAKSAPALNKQVAEEMKAKSRAKAAAAGKK
jgi:hypothetical protein